ncbi:UDP-glucose--hexose-1-phosphate uridylyltransferase [Bacillus kwashiorkori]|uniref:UDP-glucose--hexose-1-phosphate uridylyltransferase n=1 Tax=Bacillus kwashiorkori TaxID=1522318 RepID=UPI000783A5E6|nr:UDP-glucose--hexose-1-phosphate uridylyltransferase [Bacillus kwashiorkori]
MTIYETIQQLLNNAMSQGLFEKTDEIYVRNRMLALLNLDDFSETEVSEEKSNADLVEELVEYAVKKGIIEDYFDAKEILSAQVMDCFISRPSEINWEFYKRYAQNPIDATNYFYTLSKNSNYIQMKRIEKNIQYKVATEYGEIDITINLSKPEKDPKQIALERNKKSSGYPQCVLCVENEGYAGRLGYAARANHRMIRMEMLGENWFLQYSPYVYYNEHCILLSEKHRNMLISRETFERLLTFVEKIPHYFIGSNADLPIVGGSILSHDHYQGGNYEFAMAKAPADYHFTLKQHSQIRASIVKWPMSVIRLQSQSKQELVNAATQILTKWKEYSDPSVEIYAYTETTPHNTITPIARKRNEFYEIDLVLRNNRTNEDHPLGIFHPHEDVHHIKKENIGLIEVMGLAVLPARLKDELSEVESYLLGRDSQIADYHLPWANEIKQKYPQISDDNCQEILREEVGKKFLRVLHDASVFKRDDTGSAAFKRFLNHLNE